jgi:hypothetical protein
MFKTSVLVVVGSGLDTLFWVDIGLQGLSLEDVAPTILGVVHARRRNRRTVAEAFRHSRLDQGCVEALDVANDHRVHRGLGPVLMCLPGLMLDHDRFVWKWECSGQFTTPSAYRTFFEG